LHAIKYKGEKDLAIFLGRMIGDYIQLYGVIPPESWLIPVPLHPRKLKLRTYNQSAVIAQGIQYITGNPVREDVLVRNLFRTSQTTKSRLERFESLKNAFQAKRVSSPESLHFALIDDVLTTGATLEACVFALRKEYPNARISIITLAYALQF
jgi:predicted amidophosphoribosyltransferase